MKVFGIAGWSGSGKTTLLEQLLPVLIARGTTVSTIKHTHHDVDLDRPGKDSYRHRTAGAIDVMLSSSARWAILHENRQPQEPELDELIGHMTPVDLVLVEGFKRHPHPKMEVFRPALGRTFISEGDPSYVAIASDQPLGPGAPPLPVIPLNDIAAIASFIVDHCRLRD
ncbi:MAG: molybdopterin-guanine dinucleotide biosynthesis protein B [Azospirillaceae bacterium]|nr:molybdopterin-guanine dinucleotide biosynthesis protein B [Azospirillaceae bacterium]